MGWAEGTPRVDGPTVRKMLCEPDTFTARGNLVAEDEENRDEGKAPPASVNGTVASAKSFLDYDEVVLNQERVRSMATTG